MTNKNIFRELGGLDPDLIAKAAPDVARKSKHKTFVKWGSIAACFMVMVMAAALIIPMFNGSDPISIGGIDRDYKGSISGSEGDIEFPWEYKLTYEKFYTVKYNGNDYRTRTRGINESLLGEVL